MMDETKRLAIEQLERISKNLAAIGETVDYTELAIEALEQEPCDDCISRAEAQKHIYKRLYETALNNVGYKCDASDVFTNIAENRLNTWVSEIPPIPSKPKAEWIPIKTRSLTEKEKAEMGTEASYMFDCPLPDDDEEVEITTHWGNVTMDTFCRESDGCYFENYCDDGDVLAWRHKPEPYKAESEEE